MIKQEAIKPKKKYIKPAIEQLKVDNEISMVMMSPPPGDPEASLKTMVKQVLGLA